MYLNIPAQIIYIQLKNDYIIHELRLFSKITDLIFFYYSNLIIILTGQANLKRLT